MRLILIIKYAIEKIQLKKEIKKSFLYLMRVKYYYYISTYISPLKKLICTI